MQNMHNFLVQTPFSGHEQTNNTLPNENKNEKKVSIAFTVLVVGRTFWGECPDRSHQMIQYILSIFCVQVFHSTRNSEKMGIF